MPANSFWRLTLSTDALLDEDYALDWRAAVEQAVTEAGAPDLADNVPFLTRLNPLVGADPDAPEFGRAVEALVEQHLAETSQVEPERSTESVIERIPGRLLEAKGAASDGGRVFKVEIIQAGDSKNGRRYPANVLEAAAPLYEGARAYDHHRTAAELQSSTINGLVGFYRNVRSTGRGLEGDLHLLPSAKHTAEALDATVAAQAAGLPPLVGISHDAMTELRAVVTGGKRIQEAVRITKVNSCDVVADPAAGGRATRVLAGGIETDPLSNEEDGVPVTPEAVLEALSTASDEQLAGVGLKRTSESTTEQARTVEAGTLSKNEFLATLMVERKVEAAGLPKAMAVQLTEALPGRITESDVDAQIAMLKTALGFVERAGLAPSVTAQVTKESVDKKKEGIDGFFDGNGKGYRSFREMFVDVTGHRGPRTFDEDFNRVMLRECIGGGYDSAIARSTESLSSTSFDVLLADSVTRRMVAEYARPDLSTWQLIVSSMPSITDFRTQRIGRIGGYGTLPAVLQGQPYQPLTSPADEEATYAVTKRGGTEDLTLEMIANDDVRAIQKIPFKLGLAAAQTLYRFVWDILPTNAAVTYDSVALFHSSHNNTDANALSQTNLSVGRRRMRTQAAYGDTSDVLSIIPQFIVVPPHLEELAFQLSTSVVAIPATPAGPSDTPNLHQGIKPIIIDYYTDTNDWYLVADPSRCPTIEIGFYRGQREPELFTQSDPNVGSMFNSDSLTYKIRHIYSGTVLDHRGFYRGSQ
jgi:hypothetical protein